MNTKESIRENVTLTLPREIVVDLYKIAEFNETGFEDLVYSYIIDGIGVAGSYWRGQA